MYLILKLMFYGKGQIVWDLNFKIKFTLQENY
jgi:hypothetical protein